TSPTSTQERATKKSTLDRHIPGRTQDRPPHAAREIIATMPFGLLNPRDVAMPQYFVRFPSETMRPAAMPMLAADPERFRPFESETHDQILIADLSDDQRHAAEQNGAQVYEDVQFYPTTVL